MPRISAATHASRTARNAAWLLDYARPYAPSNEEIADALIGDMGRIGFGQAPRDVLALFTTHGYVPVA